MGRRSDLRRVRRALEQRLTVERVVLFGSRARDAARRASPEGEPARSEGDVRRDSDWDIAVVSPDFEGVGFLERQRLARPLVREALGVVPLDVVCYTPREYEAGRDGFLPGVIEAEGVEA